MGRKKSTAIVSRITKNGEKKYPWYEQEKGDVEFTASYNTCYFNGKEFIKIKGGESGGNYKGVEDGDIYRIAENK